MLINSIKTLAFKPIGFRNKTSPLLNLKTTYCDTFERSSDYAIGNPISFGMADEEFLGFLSKDKKTALQEMTKKTPDEQSASACLILDLTRRQIQQYKLIAEKYPASNPMQVALCAKAGLKIGEDNEKISRFESITSNPTQYIDDNQKEQSWQIPADEAIFCIK